MVFHCPVKLYSGPGALEALRAFSARRVLVVTDKYFSQKAVEIGGMVPDAQVEVFDEVVPDPPAELVAKGAAVAARFRPDLLIALGGGSPMDCAKGIRLVSEPVAFVAIPTTSGSGSEVTAFSILTHRGVKHTVVDGRLRPDAAILDDSLLADLPPGLIADTGMDLLAHCMEAICARGRSGFTDALATYAVSVALGCLERSWKGDRSVRLRLHEAAAMAGMAFDNAGLGLCHAMAHALGGRYHVSHGRLCAILLPHVMEANESALSAYAQLARACGLAGPTERMCLRNLTRAIMSLRTALEMPDSLAKAGIALDDRSRLIQTVLADKCCERNPEPVTAELVERILKAVER